MTRAGCIALAAARLEEEAARRAERCLRLAFRARASALWQHFLTARGLAAREKALGNLLEAARAEARRQALPREPQGTVVLPVST